MKQSFFILFFALGLLSCSQKTAVSTDESGKTYFGEDFNADKAISYSEFLTEMSNNETVEAVVIGYVEAVCQAKGCWMNIVPETNKEGQATFVKFKDYGFFMPFDLAGKKVVMKGKGFKEVTPVDELRHYAEDAGESPEEIAKITESKEELKFEATGVKILE